MAICVLFFRNRDAVPKINRKGKVQMEWNESLVWNAFEVHEEFFAETF